MWQDPQAQFPGNTSEVYCLLDERDNNDYEKFYTISDISLKYYKAIKA